MEPFFSHVNAQWQDVGGGLSRSILGHTPQLMAVAVRFTKGAVGTPHAHDVHHQISYVAEGSFEAIVGGERKVLIKGDAFTAPDHTLHGATSLEEGSVLIDMFSPRRDDFLA